MPATVDRYRGIHPESASMKYAEEAEVELEAIAAAAAEVAATTASAVVVQSPDMGGCGLNDFGFGKLREYVQIYKRYIDIRKSLNFNGAYIIMASFFSLH